MNSKSANFYLAAREWLINAGFEKEIEWQASRDPAAITESTFLAETAWVIYNSGFREATVRRYFDYISLCFCDWSSSAEIVRIGPSCVDSAMLAFANRPKHEAVLETARRVALLGFHDFRRAMLEDPLTFLRQLPFIGAVTVIHLAKNLGFDFAKPDRHLVRLGRSLGFRDVQSMCAYLAATTGDPVRVVDLVLWRYMERHGSSRDLSPSSSTFSASESIAGMTA